MPDDFFSFLSFRLEFCTPPATSVNLARFHQAAAATAKKQEKATYLVPNADREGS